MNAERAEHEMDAESAENAETAENVETAERTEDAGTAEDPEHPEDTETAGSVLTPVVRRRDQVPLRALAPGVTVAEMLNDEHGCRGLHQRRLRLAGTDALGRTAALAGNATLADGAMIAGGAMIAADAALVGDATLTGTAEGRGEAWYVIRGSGVLDAGEAGSTELLPGTAVWLRSSLAYRCQGNLELLAITVRADGAEDQTGPALYVTTLDACPVERTGDRQFRVLLSAGLPITQFAGLIPPGRAPEHQHAYDEVVHVLAGWGVVHLEGRHHEIGPGTSIYLPPQVPHCLENTGSVPLQVLGVFHPAGSPAAKQTT
jgi:mannose-6-phosphate isomerase-like protein (cupin superfamily)